MAKKQIKVMDTSFRDGFQSVYGARVLLKDFLPALEAAKTTGITHFEVAGGARFQSPVFYCNENPFEIMDKIREVMGPDMNLQTLARGVNVVGLESQPRDIINLHAKLFKKHGMTTIRNFDALNDVNNLIDSGNAIHNNGLNHEVTVTMMELPYGCSGAHDVAFYERVLRNILDAGIPFSSLAFKDASGTSNPNKVYETLKMARTLLGNEAHIRFHSHDTAGVAMSSYVAAIQGGADGVDLAMKPVSGGTSQPDIISLWHALKDTEYDLGIDIDKVVEAEAVFKECMKDYLLPPEALAVNPLIVFSPMPGGALTANTQMMRDNGTLDKFPAVVAAMREVVEKGGFGTSVTPVSQFYIQQAFLNVFSSKPWEKINEDYGKMVLGYYGKTPCEPDRAIVELAKQQLNLPETTEKVIDMNEKDTNKGINAAKARLQAAGLEETEENIFISATCKDKGIAFLKGEGTIGVRKNVDKATAKSSDGAYTVTVNGNKYAVKFNGDKAVVNGKEYGVSVVNGIDEKAATTTSASNGGGAEVKAPLPGAVLRILKSVGDSVQADETIIVIEAMKMETEIKAPVSGTIKEICTSANAQIQTGDVLARIE